MHTSNDTIDLAEVFGTLNRGKRWILGGAAAGFLLAILLVLVLPPRYEGTATVLLRSGSESPSSSLLSGRGGSSGSGGVLLGGISDFFSGGSGFDTEMEILTSRSVIGAVVDSLGLQAWVVSPRPLPSGALFSAARFDPDAAEAEYRFERAGDGYRVSGDGVSGTAVPGVPFRLGDATVTLRERGLPDAFTIEVVDRQEAIERIEDDLDVDEAGGDVAELVFHAAAPGIAADVPNALFAQYFQRRKTTDRGINQRRYEFLLDRTDSIRVELAAAEQSLRETQEGSGVLDPELYGEAQLEQALALQANLETAQVEARGLEQVLSQVAAGGLSAKDLAAYPTFLGNGAVNGLLSNLLALETQRTELLERRTERDPDVALLSEKIEQQEAQLVNTASAYLDGLQRQQAQIREELGRYDAVLDALPAQAQANYRLQREVERLSETMIALEAQLVQARLAAITEGGDVRQIDVAVPPDEPEFPDPVLFLPIGLISGLIVGVVGALGAGYLGRGVRDAHDAALAAGVPVIRFDPRAPLLLGGTEHWSGVLVVPVGAGARSGPVAHRIAATAALQGVRVALAGLEPDRSSLPGSAGVSDEASTTVAAVSEDVSNRSLTRLADGEVDGVAVYRTRNGDGGPDPREVRVAIGELERRYELVVVALNGVDDPATTALLAPRRSVVLAAHAGRVTRPELRSAVEVFERMGMRTAGVILHNGEPGASRGA